MLVLLFSACVNFVSCAAFSVLFLQLIAYGTGEHHAKKIQTANDQNNIVARRNAREMSDVIAAAPMLMMTVIALYVGLSK